MYLHLKTKQSKLKGCYHALSILNTMTPGEFRATRTVEVFVRMNQLRRKV